MPQAIEKAEKTRRRTSSGVTLHGGTISHEVEGTFGRRSGTTDPGVARYGCCRGRHCSRGARGAVGVTDCLTKCYGSTNKRNVAKATIEGLRMLRNAEHFSGPGAVRIEKTKVDDMPARRIGAAKPMAKGEDAGT
ncbi:MAG: hypothetical protein R3B46_04440 [Phycisphaerales bacterium]